MINVIAPNLLIDDNAVTKQFKSQLTELIVHELVHQWIGNWVSFDNWNFLWFNESFATWAARKFIGIPFNYDNFLTIDCFSTGISRLVVFMIICKSQCRIECNHRNYFQY